MCVSVCVFSCYYGPLWPEIKALIDWLISNWIRVRFGKIVLWVNRHRLTELDICYDIKLSRCALCIVSHVAGVMRALFHMFRGSHTQCFTCCRCITCFASHVCCVTRSSTLARLLRRMVMCSAKVFNALLICTLCTEKPNTSKCLCIMYQAFVGSDIDLWESGSGHNKGLHLIMHHTNVLYQTPNPSPSAR